VVVHVTQSGSSSGWVPYVVATATTLATALIVQLVVQFWVVPKVETRKRREDRWEHDVRELYELMAVRLPNVAAEAWAAQELYRDAKDSQASGYPSQLGERKRDVERTGLAYGALIGSEMDMLIDRVLSIKRKAPELAELERLFKAYEVRAIFVRGLPDDDYSTDEALRETWDQQDEARKALTAQVKMLANMRHLPRCRAG
jgi:hypothetical protein